MSSAASGDPLAIVATGLRKAYGEVRAVDGVDVCVARGEIFGLLGPNGAGKTTTLEILEGLRRPDEGRVSVLDESPWPRNPRLLRRIGVQLQATAFFEQLTAREQIRTVAALFGVSARDADEALESVGLTASAAVRTKALSGGQAQRLSVACALVHRPELVFLDEPTGALDPQARRNLWDLIRRLRTEGVTVVMTTHAMDEAEELCDRVAIMDGGRVLAVDAPAALVRSLDLPVRVTLPPEAVSEADAMNLPGVTGTQVGQSLLTLRGPDAAVILGGLAERGLLEGLQVRGATLEDVFLRYTGREYRA